MNNIKTSKNLLAKITNAIVVILASIIVLAGLVTGIWFYIYYRNHEQTNDAQVDQYITPVASRVNGYIKEIKFREHQFVHAGDTLVIIDDQEYKAKLAMAEADLENAKMNIHVLQEGAAASASNIPVRKAQLEAAEAQAWKAGQDYKRFQNLLKDEAVTEQQFEQAKTAYVSAQAHLKEIENSITSTEIGSNEAASRIPTATALVKAREAAKNNAALYLSYTVITAPFDGYVGKRTIQPGQLLREGQTLVAMVSEEKWITANFKETQIQHLHEGQAVKIKVDAFGSHVFQGKIGSLSPASGAKFSLLPPDNATGNFVKIEQRIPVRIELAGQDSLQQYLRAGMNAVVTVKDKE